MEKKKDKIKEILKMEDEEVNEFLGFDLKKRLNKNLKIPLSKMIEEFIKVGYKIKEREIEMEDKPYY